MTNEQKMIINALQAKGFGYKKIATETGISPNTVKSYIRRRNAGETVPGSATEGDIHYCRTCGKPVPQNEGRKEKKFCCDACRYKFWNSHPELITRKAIYYFTCQACGNDFSAYGKRDRKYCSHACYVKARYGGSHADE